MENILNRDFSECSIEAFAVRLRQIVERLRDNPYFRKTEPPLAELEIEQERLAAAMRLPAGLAKESAVQASRLELELMLEDLADSLEHSAKGDRAKLASTGFELHPTRPFYYTA